MISRLNDLWRLGRRISELGPTPWDRLWILVVALAMPLKDRIPWARPMLVRVRLSKLGSVVHCSLRQRSDLLVLDEVFVLDAYDVDTAEPPRVVFDLGSNIGMTILYFRVRYPHARIYGFEPDPLAFAVLQENTRPLRGVEILPYAVADLDGPLAFYPRPETFASSVVPDGSAGGPVTVEARSLETLAEDLAIDAIDLLKVDIEGAEFRVLSAFDGRRRVQTIIGELHAELIEATVEEFLALLEGFEVEIEHQPMPSLPAAERYAFVARSKGE